MRRRQALRWIVVSVVLVGGGGAALRLGSPRLRRMARAWLDGATRLRPAPGRPLEPDTERALLAVTDTLLEATPIPQASRERYAEFFRWKSVNVPGYGALYAHLAAALDRAAGGMYFTRAGRPTFAQAPAEVRRRALANVVAPTAAASRRELFLEMGSERWVFRARVTEEVLRLFARTDAMLRLGYEAWPGEVRGLTAYRSAPPGTGA